MREEEKREKKNMKEREIDFVAEYLGGREYMSVPERERIKAMIQMRKDIRNGKYD